MSVIIPSYNHGRFLPQTIQNVLSQSYPDIEIIIVDDGSTDDTRRVITPYKKVVNYIYQENKGLSEARNTGFRHSTGEFIQFLDADDLLGTQTLSVQAQYLIDHPHIHLSICRNHPF